MYATRVLFFTFRFDCRLRWIASFAVFRRRRRRPRAHARLLSCAAVGLHAFRIPAGASSTATS
jgi:hypothetical protein